MNKFFLSVYDSAANMWLDPFMAPTIEFAIRGFRQAVNTEGHQFALFPDDYTLFSVGGFDPSTGKLLPQEPVSLGVAVTFVDRPGPILQDREQANA